MERVLNEQHLERTSLVHRLDPRLKLLATLAFVLTTTGIPPQGWMSFFMLGGLALGTIVAARIPLMQALRRSAIALPFVAMAAVSLLFVGGGRVLWACPFGWSLAVTDEGLCRATSIMVRGWLSVLMGGVLVATTPFPDLIQAMRALHIPDVLIMTISFTYRYLFVLADEAMRMQTAREARSAGAGGTVWWRIQVLGRMIGTLFIRSYERSERIYVAMLSRGYTGQARALAPLTWTARDTRIALGWIVLLISAVGLGWL